MSLVLAIEPDTRQADALRQIVRDRVGAELELVTSTQAAVMSMNWRVPDLLLFSATISTSERDKVVQRFQSLTQVPDQPALTIVPLGYDDERRETSRFLRETDQGYGSSEVEFADLIADALARVQEARLAQDTESDAVPHTQPDFPRFAEPLASGQPASQQRHQAIFSSVDADEEFFAEDLALPGERLDDDSSSIWIEATGSAAVVTPHDGQSRSPRHEETVLLQPGADATPAAGIHHVRAAAIEERVARLGSFQAAAEALLATMAVTEARAVSEAEARNALGADPAEAGAAAEQALTDIVPGVSEADHTLAAERSRVRAETERTVNELGLDRAAADHHRETPFALGDADETVAEAAAARSVDAELARVREEAEVRLQAELERLRQSASAARLAERDAHLEAERRRDEAARQARDAANQAAALALETQAAQVRTDAEHRLDAILARVRRETERARLAEQSETRVEVERLVAAATRDLRSAAEEAAARALETEVARIGAEAETRLQTEVARIRSEAEHVRLSDQADARIEAARIRDTAAQEARAIAEVTLKAELERVRAETRTRPDAPVVSARAPAEQRADADVRSSRERVAEVNRTAAVRVPAAARGTSRANSDRDTGAGDPQSEHGRSDAHVESWRRRAARRVGGWRRPAIWTLSAAAALVVIAGGSMVLDVTSAVRAARRTAAAWVTRGDTASPARDTEPITTAAPVSPTLQVGDLRVESMPAGARVMLDGRERGLSPLTLTGVRAGRHTLMLRGPGGTVTRTITVRADEQTVAAEQIISGFLTVFSRIRLDIYLGGRRIGTTEDGQLLVAPGRHTITLTNDHFNYRSTVDVEVQPGATTSHTVALPNGSLRVNAPPGAEVWIEGERVGTAPLGELSVPIGTREVLVKDPEHGERRQIVEVRYGHPTEVTLVRTTIANEGHLVRLAP